MTKGTTKSGGQKHSLDKFYTKESVARECLSELTLTNYTEVIEPSAGSGSFSRNIENCTAYDLDPEHESITQADWFTISRDRGQDSNILVVGNPPFGQQNNLAISFINHAAKFANTIAFILPLSFQKIAVQERIDLNLHLVLNKQLEKNSFTLHGQDMDVPCVFQVWEYRENEKRVKQAKIEIPGFNFVKKDANPDFYIQRVGGRAGTAGLDWANRSIQSNYFVKLDPALFTNTQDIVEIINDTHFPEKDYSVGPRSLSKQELLSNIKENLIQSTK